MIGNFLNDVGKSPFGTKNETLYLQCDEMKKVLSNQQTPSPMVVKDRIVTSQPYLRINKTLL